jgi:hypothetical protein
MDVGALSSIIFGVARPAGDAVLLPAKTKAFFLCPAKAADDRWSFGKRP